ncbi:UNVERIFIED_ORG: hypothetical protein J2X79_004270 [Arthrobacter globiformis]|nr:hypothetical protein [Arthrobacter globiformis]
MPLDSCLFHLEKISEVCLDPKGNDAYNVLAGKVAHGDPLLNAGADFTQSLNDQRAVGIAIGPWNPADKQSPVRFLHLGRQRFQRLIIDGKAPP